MQTVHQISETLWRNTGHVLQACSQPSYQQQAPLFPLCPSESLCLFMSIKACCCLLSLPVFPWPSPCSLARSDSRRPSLLLMLPMSPFGSAQELLGRAALPSWLPTKQGATTITTRQACDALPGSSSMAEHKERSSATEIKEMSYQANTDPLATSLKDLICFIFFCFIFKWLVIHADQNRLKPQTEYDCPFFSLED